MAGRPCNPDSDLKRLWRFLLPGTPLPQCGWPAEADAAERDDASPAQTKPAGAEPTAADRNA
jgi:hypothetical protein